MIDEPYVFDVEVHPALRLAALAGPVVMVDELQSWGVAKEGMAAHHFGPGTKSSHMTVAGDIEALHAMAVKLKIRRFFQAPKKSHDLPHYDLVPANREKALALGALFAPARFQVRVRRMLRGFLGLPSVASSIAAAAPAPFKLFRPADLDENPWAACGQVALAALLQRPLASVRGAFPPHRWCNLSQMRQALDALGVAWTNGPIDAWPPRRGLVLLQLLGPWTEPGVPAAAALKHTHWIACSPIVGEPHTAAMICDVNAVDAGWNGGWTPDDFWRQRVMAPLMAAIPKCSGRWRIRAAIEVPR